MNWDALITGIFIGILVTCLTFTLVPKDKSCMIKMHDGHKTNTWIMGVTYGE